MSDGKRYYKWKILVNIKEYKVRDISSTRYRPKESIWLRRKATMASAKQSFSSARK